MLMVAAANAGVSVNSMLPQFGLAFGAALVVLLFTVPVALRRIRRLQSDLDRASAELRETTGFLTRFSNGIWQRDGVDGVMHAAALNVAEKVDAESVGIYEFVDGKLRGVGVSGPYPLVRSIDKPLLTPYEELLRAMHRELWDQEEGVFCKLLENRQREIIPDASVDSRFSMLPNAGTLRSVMIAPLLVDGVLTGAVCAVNNKTVPGRPFSPEQMECLSQLRNEIIMIQDLVRVYSEMSRRDRIDQELSFARTLQLSLLPSDSPEWGDFYIEARTCPAKEVNGDFYDFIRIDDDRMLVLLGDACGKGIPACMLSAMTRSFARSMVGTFTTLNKFMRDINEKLNRDTDVDRFVTLGCCLLDRKNNLLEFGRAGHTDLVGFIHRHIRVISPDGVALGMLPDDLVSFDTICISVDPESTFMMYSDGMTEAVDKEKVEFGQARLSEVFSDSCAKHDETSPVIDEVMQRVSEYEADQSDDRTVVLIHRGGHYAGKI